MMQIWRRRLLEVAAQLRQPGLGLFRLRVLFRRDADTDGGEDGTEIVVVLQRRPVALQPVPGTVLHLQCPHVVKRFPGDRMQLALAHVMERQSYRRRHHVGVALRLVALLSAVPVGGALFEELPHRQFLRRRLALKRWPRHQIGHVGVAGSTLALLGPVQGHRVEELRPFCHRGGFRPRLVGLGLSGNRPDIRRDQQRCPQKHSGSDEKQYAHVVPSKSILSLSQERLDPIVPGDTGCGCHENVTIRETLAVAVFVKIARSHRVTPTGWVRSESNGNGTLAKMEEGGGKSKGILGAWKSATESAGALEVNVWHPVDETDQVGTIRSTTQGGIPQQRPRIHGIAVMMHDNSSRQSTNRLPPIIPARIFMVLSPKQTRLSTRNPGNHPRGLLPSRANAGASSSASTISCRNVSADPT